MKFRRFKRARHNLIDALENLSIQKEKKQIMSSEVTEERTRQALEYQVSPNGEVRGVQVKTVDGNDWQVNIRRAGATVPFARSRRAINDKWLPLLKAIVKQEIGLWYVYGPFRDEKELILAKSAVGRWNRNYFMQRNLHGKSVKASYNKETFELGVLVYQPEENE